MEIYEGKIIEINENLISERLEMLSAELIFESDIKSWYFDFSDKRLKNHNKILRVRKIGNNMILSLKENHHNDNINLYEEHDIEFNDFEEMSYILKKLDIKEHAYDFRQRLSYKLNDTIVKISIYPEIPAFLSIEANSEDELKESVVLLGFSMKDIKPWSSKDVLDFYFNKDN